MTPPPSVSSHNDARPPARGRTAARARSLTGIFDPAMDDRGGLLSRAVHNLHLRLDAAIPDFVKRYVRTPGAGGRDRNTPGHAHVHPVCVTAAVLPSRPIMSATAGDAESELNVVGPSVDALRL